MEGQGRPRFCAKLNGDIGSQIFAHVRLHFTRFICRAVCRSWRQLIMLLPMLPRGSYGMFGNYIRHQEDQHMACLSLWMPRFAVLLDVHQQAIVIDDAIRYDRPTALRLFLAHSNRTGQRTCREALDLAICTGSRAVIEQVLVPAATLSGDRKAFWLRMLTHASFSMFEWYCNRFPIYSEDAAGIKMGDTPFDLDAKIMWMYTSRKWSHDWWTTWFNCAAGIRGSWFTASGEHFYHDRTADDDAKYNADVAVAIVQYVLGAVPQVAVDYLSNKKVRTNRLRDDMLLARLAPWCSSGAGDGSVPQERKRAVIDPDEESDVMEELGISLAGQKKKKTGQRVRIVNIIFGANEMLPSEDDDL